MPITTKVNGAYVAPVAVFTKKAGAYAAAQAFGKSSRAYQSALGVAYGIGYKISDGIALDNYAATYSQSLWTVANVSGSGAAPTSTSPRISLGTGTASGNYGRVIHRSPFTFGSVASTDYLTLDIEFVAGNGPEAGDSFSVILSSDNYSAKSLQTGVTFQRYVEGRIALTFPTREFAAASGEVFDGTTFNYLAIVYKKGAANAGVSKQCYVYGLYRANKARPKFILEFDVGYNGVFNIAKPLLDSRGMKATVNVSNSLIDSDATQYMSTAQLQSLYSAGWDMSVRNNASHDTYANVSDLTTAMQADRQWNVDRGMSRGSDHAIYSVGIMTANSKPALQAAGYKSARTTYQRNVCMDIGSPDLYNIPSLGVTSGAGVVAIAIQYIDDAIAAGKTSIFYTHQVADTQVTNGITTADLTSILDYVKSKSDAGLIDVMTKSDWYNGLGRT